MVTIGRTTSTGSGPGRRAGRTSAHQGPVVTSTWLLSHFCVGAILFYCGFWLGTTTSTVLDGKDGSSINTPRSLLSEPKNALGGASASTAAAQQQQQQQSSVFPESVHGMVVGSATVSRADFIEQFDIGVPWDEVRPDAADVFLLYSSNATLPSQYSVAQHFDSSLEATQNCHSMKVILTKANNHKASECIAVVGQWSSFHLHHFLRLRNDLDHDHDPDKDKDAPLFQPDYPWRYVSRRHELNGKTPQLPQAEQTRKYWPILVDYLQKLDTTLERLKPVASKAAGGDSNTIVVMVCNLGQSELLVNFVCAARGRGLSVDNILLFATDTETYQLAQSLGVGAFDVQDAFGDMPKGAARQYGDKRFTGMMLSKVYCMHLVNSLGYDVLFQDVDVVWYRDPLQYFHSAASRDFDFYFQDDGAHTNRYAPYSPNSGFYYVRYNERTRYFFEVFLRMGELILASGSHQSVLNDLLTEQASSKGLKVKVFQRDSELGNNFPGGFHYHSRKSFMKDMIKGKKKPYIFHMSWTKNKENKRKFYQQMGDWFVKDVCIGQKVAKILAGASGDDLSKHCCSAEPLIQCHYRDKPSKIPCKESDPIDKGRPSFW